MEIPAGPGAWRRKEEPPTRWEFSEYKDVRKGCLRGTEVLAAGVRGLLAGPFADISKVLASAPVQNQAV